MSTTITEMKQTLLSAGTTEEEIAKLNEKQIEERYKNVCKTLTSSLSGETSTYKAPDELVEKAKASSDYENALREHREKIDKLISEGEYLTAIKEMFFNAPKNPNLIAGDAPGAAIGGAGIAKFGKALLKVLKNPKMLADIIKSAKNFAVKSFDELYNVVKSFLVQSKPSKTLPQYVNITKNSGYSAKNVVEALRFGNIEKPNNPKAGMEIIKYFMNRFGIKINPNDIKAVQVEENGAVKILYTYFNPKTGKSIIFNEQGRFQSTVSYTYDKSGKLLDAVVDNGSGVTESIRDRLFNPRATIRPDSY